jgi:RNA polymerase sigma-70 factor (ECF subfamily)
MSMRVGLPAQSLADAGPMALAAIPTDLIEMARGGDRPAIEDLLKAIAPDVYRIAFSMLRNHDDADEVAQESLIRVFRYLPKLKEIDKFPSWTMRVVVNQVQSWRMRQSRQRLLSLPEGQEPEAGRVVIVGSAGADPRAAAIGGETRRQIEQALADLPTRQQAAIVLFEIEGSSIREVAQAMQCSEGAVKFNIHEARKKLQKRLGHLLGLRGGIGRKRAASADS